MKMPCVLQKTVSIQRQHKFSRFASVMKLMWNLEPKGDDSDFSRIRNRMIITLFALGHPQPASLQVPNVLVRIVEGQRGRSCLECGQGSPILRADCPWGVNMSWFSDMCQTRVWVLSAGGEWERRKRPGFGAL